MDLVKLRGLVGSEIQGLTIYTHRELAEACEELGLPKPPDEKSGSKRDRVNQSFHDLPDSDLPMVAERILAGYLQVSDLTRNEIQDVLWADQAAHEIPKRTRREIAQALELRDLVYSPDRFSALLSRLWVLGSDSLSFFTGVDTSLRANIEQHVYRNPGDWTTEDLFEQLGVFDASNMRFAMFLEGLVSADVIPDEPAQRRIVNTVNPHLRSVGAELRETGIDGGYPIFSVVSTQSARTGQPLNVIFASKTKPDIRFLDAINNKSRSSKALMTYLPTTARLAVTASDGVTCRRGGKISKSSPVTPKPESLCTSGSSEVCPITRRHSGTCLSSTMNSMGARCQTFRRSCPKYDCTGTQKQSATAALKPCCDSVWTS